MPLSERSSQHANPGDHLDCQAWPRCFWDLRHGAQRYEQQALVLPGLSTLSRVAGATRSQTPGASPSRSNVEWVARQVLAAIGDHQPQFQRRTAQQNLRDPGCCAHRQRARNDRQWTPLAATQCFLSKMNREIRSLPTTGPATGLSRTRVELRKELIKRFRNPSSARSKLQFSIV